LKQTKYQAVVRRHKNRQAGQVTNLLLWIRWTYRCSQNEVCS